MSWRRTEFVLNHCYLFAVVGCQNVIDQGSFAGAQESRHYYHRNSRRYRLLVSHSAGYR